MKRIIVVLMIAALTVALCAGTSFALVTGAVTADTFVRSTDALNHNGEGLEVASGGMNGACNVASTSYTRWTLTGLNAAQVSTVIMTLTVFSGPTVAVDLTLYKVADTTWNETTLASPGPAIGDLIQTVTLPANSPSGTQILFNNATLVQYIKDSAGGAASFALRMTACGGANLPVVLLYDLNNGTPGNAPNPGDPGTAPFLQVRNATPVTLRFFRSADPAVNWPLIAGGAALLALAGGLGVYRWRVSRVRAR